MSDLPIQTRLEVYKRVLADYKKAYHEWTHDGTPTPNEMCAGVCLYITSTTKYYGYTEFPEIDDYVRDLNRKHPYRRAHGHIANSGALLPRIHALREIIKKVEDEIQRIEA